MASFLLTTAAYMELVRSMPTQFMRGDRHVYRNIAGEHLLIALHGDSPEPLFALTPTAAFLWERLDEWCTPDDLAIALSDRFEVERERAKVDVSDFLAQLEEVRAIQMRERNE
jgi:hypothetical protein